MYRNWPIPWLGRAAFEPSRADQPPIIALRCSRRRRVVGFEDVGEHHIDILTIADTPQQLRLLCVISQRN